MQQILQTPNVQEYKAPIVTPAVEKQIPERLIKDPDSLPVEEVVHKIIQERKELTQEEIATLERVFNERLAKHDKAVERSKAFFDCERLAHYLVTGKIGSFKESKSPQIHKVDLEKEITHRPYTCYKIWQPRAPWVREKYGFWGGVHFFTHLENGQYISKNGLGTTRFFDSLIDMLREDAFPFGYLTEDYENSKDIKKAMIGISMEATISP